MRHSLFKWICMACASCLLAPAALQKPAPGASPLKLKGRVADCEAAEDDSNVKLTLKLSFEFTNTGDAPVLVLWDELLMVARRISGTPPGESEEKSLYLGSSLPSIERGEGWAKRRREVDRESPPEEVKRLAPGEALTLETEDWFYMSRERRHPEGNVSWDQIKRAGRVSLSVDFQTWPLNIEPRERPDDDDKKLGRRLRERWKAHGLLLLDGVTSEPIELNPQVCKQGQKTEE